MNNRLHYYGLTRFERKRDEITDFVQSLPGFKECDVIETWMAQMLNDDEIVTFVQAKSDPVDNEMDEDGGNNNESSKGPSNARAFPALQTTTE
ncbi:hypothetical protein TNCV_2754891 [Trichonephila clavipes]|nr:hypothetical protein TNCV_2754891 [Trichonephila clavipes]